MAAGLGLFALVPMDATFVAHILPPMVLMGIGSGVRFPAPMTLAMSDATPEDSGVVSGLANTAGQVGGAFGASLLAALATVVTADLSAAGRDMLPALAGGYMFAIGVGAIIMAASVVVALFVVRSNKNVQPLTL